MQEANKLTVLVNPKLTEAAAVIEKAFVQRRTLIVAGKCHVNYTGRANSTLESGERLLIIKEDGSLLVHRPVGYEPVNWQPAGSVFHVQTREDELEVHGVRQKPRDIVCAPLKEVSRNRAEAQQTPCSFRPAATEDDMH